MAVVRKHTAKHRRELKRWQEVGTSNIVALRMELARFKLEDLGNHGGVGDRACYISGPPGVGKTHSVVEQERNWLARGITPLRFRPRNVHELLDYFAAARGQRPLIMEEADIIFRSKPMFEILKQATDPLTPDVFYLLRKVKGEPEKIEVPISLNVPIVVTTNMDLLGQTGWDQELLADRDALFNRFQPIVIPDDPLALWEWSVYLALSSHLTMRVSLRNPGGGKPREEHNPLSVQAAALDWFTDNLNHLEVISPRTLKKVAQAMGRAHRGDMPVSVLDQELAGLCGPERVGNTVPAKSDWSELLVSMPKTATPMKKAA